MMFDKRNLLDARLYLVLDTQVNDYKELFDVLEKAVSAGVDVVQLRDKGSDRNNALQFSQQSLKFLGGKVPFIINDRVELALASNADGVHLGQEDSAVSVARKKLGREKIIGVSCQTLEHARQAESDGADYIGFGSVFTTETKPGRAPMDLDLLQEVIRAVRIPIFAIGGITPENVEQILKLGVRRIAVTRAISRAKDVAATVKRFEKILAAYPL